MSDPSGLLQPVARAALKADAGLIALFPGGVVKVYDGVAPVNAIAPYIVLGLGAVEPLVADQFDGSIVTSTTDVWSLTDPPGFAEVKAIAPIVQACLAGLSDVAGFRIDYDPAGADTQYLMEQDGRTTRALLRSRYTASPQ